MRRAVITVAAVLVVVGATEGWANLLPVNSNTIVQDGIEYYIETDKIVYDLGEDVALVFRKTNLTDELWDVRWLGRGSDIIVEAMGEDFRRVWSAYRGGYTGPKRLQLPPGESVEIVDVWPQVDFRGTSKLDDDVPASPGMYRVTGSFLPTDVSVAVDITIIPEPATIVFLIGGTWLLRLKRSR